MTTTIAKLLPILSLTFCLGACGQDPLAGPPPQAAGAAGTSGAAGKAPAVTPVELPQGVTPLGYITVTKTAGSCSDPLGTPYAPASAAEIASLLVGKWRRCGGSTSAGSGNDFPGLEFARDRGWRALDESLGPKNGFDTTGVWYMSKEDPADMVVNLINVVRVHLTGRGGASGYSVDFLRSPLRLRISTGEELVWQGE